MDTSDRDYKRLEKLVARWRYVRWFQLVYGAVVVSLGVFLVAQAHELSAAGTWNEEAVTYYPLGMMLFVVGFQLILPALAKWRGDPVHLMLLKVACGHQMPQAGRGCLAQDGDAPPAV